MVSFCLISWSCQEHKTPSSWGLDSKTFECGNTTLSLKEDANHSEWWNMSLSTLGTHWIDWHSWQFLLKTRFKISGNNYRTPEIKLGCFPLQVLQLQFPCCNKSLFLRSLDTGLSEGVSHSCIIQQYQTFLSLRWICVERSCPHTDITLSLNTNEGCFLINPSPKCNEERCPIKLRTRGAMDQSPCSMMSHAVTETILKSKFIHTPGGD